jgi:hypothetical protein
MADDTLTPKQRAALDALMTEPSVLAAAEQAGCSDRSIRRWLRQPAFQHELQRRQDELWSATKRRLTGYSLDAAATLHAIATAEQSADGARVSAAAKLLELARGLVADDLDARVARLEEALNKEGSEQ